MMSRRDSARATLRAQRAHLDRNMQLESCDPTAKITFDQTLVNELASLRFIEAHRHVTIVGPIGVGKTFLAHAFGHIECRRDYSVIALRADRMLKSLTHARLDRTYEVELRKLIAVDLLIVDDFGIDAMSADESRDAFEIMTERHRSGSLIVTFNRGPDEWRRPWGPIVVRTDNRGTVSTKMSSDPPWGLKMSVSASRSPLLEIPSRAQVHVPSKCQTTMMLPQPVCNEDARIGQLIDIKRSRLSLIDQKRTLKGRTLVVRSWAMITTVGLALLGAGACGDADASDLLPGKPLAAIDPAGVPTAPLLNCELPAEVTLENALKVEGRVVDVLSGAALADATIAFGDAATPEVTSDGAGLFTMQLEPPIMSPANWRVLTGNLPDSFALAVRLPEDQATVQLELPAASQTFASNLAAVGIREDTEAVVTGVVVDCRDHPLRDAVVIARGGSEDLTDPPTDSELGLQRTYYGRGGDPPVLVAIGEQSSTDATGIFAVADVPRVSPHVIQVWAFSDDESVDEGFEGLALIAQYQVLLLGSTVLIMDVAPTEGAAMD